jgi:uncharacterized protein
MSEQPEALRLADDLEDWSEGPDTELLVCAAAAELRRLHAEVQEQCRLNGMGSEREARLMAENEALRETLKKIERGTYDAMTAALVRAALSKAEEA